MSFTPMPAIDGPNEHIAALLEEATQAQHDGDFEHGIISFADAMLEHGGVDPPDGYQTRRLSRQFGRLVGKPLLVAEVALPPGLVGWGVQRVTVDQLEVGRSKTPGYYITERFRLGTVNTIIAGPEDNRTVATAASGNVRNTVYRNITSAQDVCSVMNLAAHQGTVISRERIGKRTAREIMQTAGAYVGNVFVEMMTADDD